MGRHRRRRKEIAIKMRNSSQPGMGTPEERAHLPRMRQEHQYLGGENQRKKAEECTPHHLTTLKVCSMSTFRWGLKSRTAFSSNLILRAIWHNYLVLQINLRMGHWLLRRRDIPLQQVIKAKRGIAETKASQRLVIILKVMVRGILDPSLLWNNL